MKNEIGLLIKLSTANDINRKLKQAHELGFTSCQISTYKPELYTYRNADIINECCKAFNIKISLLWAGWPGKCKWNFVGGPSTIGLVPLEVRKERAAIMKEASDFASLIDVDRIATHAGFIPEDMNDPLYVSLIPVLRNCADYCRRNGQFFCFETGQETPVTLLRTIQDIDMENVGVNLDPANLVMYGKSNAVDAVRILGKYIKGVHIKDGRYPTNGRDLGIEVPIGVGDVDMTRFLKALENVGYKDPLTIEIELDRRVGKENSDSAIRFAVEYLRSYQCRKNKKN